MNTIATGQIRPVATEKIGRVATVLSHSSVGFIEAKSGTSLFIFHRGPDTIYLLLYVDDIILIASSMKLLHRTISALQQEFAMKDLRPLFITFSTSLSSVVRTGCSSTSRAQLQSTSRQSLLQIPSLPVDSEPPIQDTYQFRSIANALQYLMFTRPEITYAIQ
jgi:hypothetical protein